MHVKHICVSNYSFFDFMFKWLISNNKYKKIIGEKHDMILYRHSIVFQCKKFFIITNFF